MKKLITVVVILLYTVVNVVFANTTNEDIWSKANKLYNQQQYDSAANLYEQLVTDGYSSAELYYNLGNTYYRLNNISKAVLNYERCLRIAPDNKTAQDNLTLTESRIANRIQPIKEIFFIRWWHNITTGSNATALAISAIVLFLLVLALYTARRLNKLNIKYTSQLLGTLNIVCLTVIILAFVAANNQANHNKAVIMIADTPFMQQPNGKAQSYLPEGTSLKIEDNNKEWTEVTLPDGRKGWVSSDMIEKI